MHGLFLGFEHNKSGAFSVSKLGGQSRSLCIEFENLAKVYFVDW